MKQLLTALLILICYLGIGQKPLNIKMQPRWRGESPDVDSAWSKWAVSGTIPDSLLKSMWINPNDAERGGFTIMGVPQNDTTKVIMLVSDTSSQNGFRSSRCWWMEGYKVQDLGYLGVDEKGYVILSNASYLDQSKIPLKKNIIVWMSKEIKP